MHFPNKARFYAKYLSPSTSPSHPPLLGNQLRTFATLQAVLAATPRIPLVTVRGFSIASGTSLFLYAIPILELEEAVHALPTNIRFTFNETPPDAALLIQGEVMRAYATPGLYLHYSTTPGVSMRQALAPAAPTSPTPTPTPAASTLPRHATGSVAHHILNHFLDSNSYADIMDLLSCHDEASDFCTIQGPVVEFSTYSRPLGILPHRNTIIWEVRHY